MYVRLYNGRASLTLYCLFSIQYLHICTYVWRTMRKRWKLSVQKSHGRDLMVPSEMGEILWNQYLGKRLFQNGFLNTISEISPHTLCLLFLAQKSTLYKLIWYLYVYCFWKKINPVCLFDTCIFMVRIDNWNLPNKIWRSIKYAT